MQGAGFRVQGAGGRGYAKARQAEKGKSAARRVAMGAVIPPPYNPESYSLTLKKRNGNIYKSKIIIIKTNNKR